MLHLTIPIFCWQINVGDILCIEDGDEFPCDLVLLSTSNSNGKASILTANLDGETNLKNQIAPSLTRHFHHSPDKLQYLKAQVECENPNPDLQGFVGRMKVQKETEDDAIMNHSQKGHFRTPSRGMSVPQNLPLVG